MVRVTFLGKLRLLTPRHFSKSLRATRASIIATPHSVGAIRNELTHPRLGLAIPKKRLNVQYGVTASKRQIRESFRLHQHELPPIDIVVIAQSTRAWIRKPDLSQLLDKLWRTLARRSNG